jgi:SAM-dependent methyltransferase
MTALDPAVAAAPPSDPFAAPSEPRPVDRPRVLSYAGRWGRSRRWLPAGSLRVLDVGCAFGYGSAAIGASGPAGRVIVGVEQDPEHLAMAREQYPWLPIIAADATALPVADACADAVLLLDVIEHIAEPERALAEAERVLRPDGVLIVSVPHAGPLQGLDALNRYAALRHRHPSWPPLEPATGSAGGVHRHFGVDELARLLGPGFRVERVARTGLGLEELVYLAALLIRVPRRQLRIADSARLLHLIVYLLDDLVPWGPIGYTLTVRARRLVQSR